MFGSPPGKPGTAEIEDFLPAEPIDVVFACEEGARRKNRQIMALGVRRKTKMNQARGERKNSLRLLEPSVRV